MFILFTLKKNHILFFKGNHIFINIVEPQFNYIHGLLKNVVKIGKMLNQGYKKNIMSVS